MRRPAWIAALGPGLLIAATGVGAGDLATGAFTGNKLGLAVLWAAAAGAFIKFVLNEGLARWQLATGETLLEGAVRAMGRPVQVLFLIYLLPWTFFVGGALMSACGVAAHAIFPVFDTVQADKVFWGLTHSAAGAALAVAGGYRLFEKVMAGAIGLMFVTVLITAGLLGPGAGEIAAGLVPKVPQAAGGGLAWTIALMGGVGGTLTVLCYGYWIREAGRAGPADMASCRIDLGAGYLMTALFTMAMVVIGSRTPIEGKGANLIVALGAELTGPLGPAGRWVFLAGAWAAIASSLLGVWQSVPYIFADFWSLARGESPERRARTVSTKSPVYRGYLAALAVVPALGLFMSFRDVQKLYAVVGAGFMPLLAAALLILNNRRGRMGGLRNRWPANAVLAGTVAFFLLAGWLKFR